MSDTENSPSSPPGPPPAKRSGCLTAVMAVIGLILLLPGFCALLFGGALLWDRRIEPDILALVLIGLALGAGGIALLRLAIRGRRS